MLEDDTNKETVRRLYRSENRIKTLLFFFVLFLCLLSIMTAIYQVATLQAVQQQQKDAVKSRNQQLSEIQNQNTQLKGYIKCILLLRYDNPELNPNSPKQDVEKALDRCAENN